MRIGPELTVIDIGGHGVLVEGGTRLTPGARLDLHVIARSGHVLVRSTVTRAWVSHLRSDDALPTRAVIPDNELGDVERAKQRLGAAGFDGAVVLRPVAVEERIKYSSAYIANDYDSFWGYYGAGWGDPWQAGPMKVDTHLRVETLVYSVTTDELLWVGVTRTINPESIRVTIDQIAAAVVEDLRKHGLVPATR